MTLAAAVGIGALIGPARQVIREFLTAERTVAQLVNVSSGRLGLAIPQILALYPTAELIDMMSANRAYSANITVMNAAKQMAQRALEIGR